MQLSIKKVPFSRYFSLDRHKMSIDAELQKDWLKDLEM